MTTNVEDLVGMLRARRDELKHWRTGRKHQLPHGLPSALLDAEHLLEDAATALERLREKKISEQDIHDWFTSHSSAAVARVVADGQSVIDERMADGVFD